MSSTQPRSATPFLTAFLALAALPVAALAQEAPATPDQPASSDIQACTLTIEPAALPAGGAAQSVQATPSIDLEAIDAVRADDESGLQVALVNSSPITLGVDASAADEGEWSIALVANGNDTCTGTLRVESGEPR